MTSYNLSEMGYKTISLDALNRLPVAQPQGLFSAQFTKDLQPLLLEPITNGSGATVTYDSTNRCALMTFSSTPTGGKAYMQSFEHFRYQPGNAQEAIITFNMLGAVTNCTKFVRYGDTVNAYMFSNDGANNIFSILSGTDLGNSTANQSTWNIDKMDGTLVNNPSGALLDITKDQLFIIDLAALYTEGAKMGFIIDGKNVWCHRFSFSNTAVYPYIQTANLPVSAGMTCTGTVSTTMRFHCCAVQTSGGNIILPQYSFPQASAGVAVADGVFSHLLSIRPKTTFNSITNRVNLVPNSVSVLVTGNAPIEWQLVIGQVISGTTTFNDVNTTYSVAEYNTAGTISGTAALVADSGYVAASNQSKGSISQSTIFRYPICLDAAGATNVLRTMSLIAKGAGGASNCRGMISWTGAR